MEKERKLTTLGISTIIILGIIIFLLLSMSYNINLFIRLIIMLLAIVFFYFSYKKNTYLLALSILTSITMFISLESSFALNIWSAIIISLITALIFLYAHEKLKHKDKFSLLLLILFIIIWTILSINVYYLHDWILENLVTIPALVLIVISARWFKMSNLSYTLIFIYMSIHLIGVHYTYPEVPIGLWLKEFFNLTRNNYDRIVHLCFGLFLAYPVREILIRISNLRGILASYIPIEFILALSAFYEILEWVVIAVFGGDLGIAYVGTQGDFWDAQKDMALAVLGAIITSITTALLGKRKLTK